MGISNICAVTGYGDETNPIAAALKAFSRLRPSNATATTPEAKDQQPPQQETAASETPSSNAKTTTPNTKQLPNALRLFTGTYDIVCRRFPWKLTAFMLNTLLNGSSPASPAAASAASAPAGSNVLQSPPAAAGLARLLDSELFPGSAGSAGLKEVKEEGWEKEKGAAAPVPAMAAAAAAGLRRRPLPDDFAMRGFPWVEKYFPEGWFANEEKINDDEKYFELASMMEERRERVVGWGAASRRERAASGCGLIKRQGGLGSRLTRSSWNSLARRLPRRGRALSTASCRTRGRLREGLGLNGGAVPAPSDMMKRWESTRPRRPTWRRRLTAAPSRAGGRARASGMHAVQVSEASWAVTLKGIPQQRDLETPWSTWLSTPTTELVLGFSPLELT
jgi:hypothetical protein